MSAACVSPLSRLEMLGVDLSNDVERLLKPLQDDRDMWKARAQAYKAAFEGQTRRLKEAIDLCTATRVELENVRIAQQLREPVSVSRANSNVSASAKTGKSSEGTYSSHTLGVEDTSEISQPEVHWQSTPVTQEHFGQVEELVSHNDFATARKEIDRILPGRLSNEARIEGLLLKSAICRVSGPEWVLDGLAQCSEALTLCSDIAGLEFLLPKIHYHRGLCLLHLRELEHARAARAASGQPDPSLDGAGTPGSPFGDFDSAVLAKRRSAFEEHRPICEGFLSSLKEGESGVRDRIAYVSPHL